MFVKSSTYITICIKPQKFLKCIEIFGTVIIIKLGQES